MNNFKREMNAGEVHFIFKVGLAFHPAAMHKKIQENLRE